MNPTLRAELNALTARIESIPPQIPLVDVMRGDGSRQISLFNCGFVELMDVMPRLVPEGRTADYKIPDAARVSYAKDTITISDDVSLMRFLLRHRHTSPFEMVELFFRLKVPIFVARQMVRHRTASLNEMSGRYSVMVDEFYRPSPEDIRQQSATNRQGGGDAVEQMTAEQFLAFLDQAEAVYPEYLKLTDAGLARELARIGLPVSLYTQFIWKCDLHNLFHFLGLRMDHHAQWEMQQVAKAMFALIWPIVPDACQAFIDYRYEAMSLTRLEIEALRTGQPLASTNNRELREWEAKKAALGLSD